jgi:hypothetical protein
MYGQPAYGQPAYGQPAPYGQPMPYMGPPPPQNQGPMIINLGNNNNSSGTNCPVCGH